MSACPLCGSPVPERSGRGRPRRWCSDRCRNHAKVRRFRGLRRAAYLESVAAQLRSPNPPWWSCYAGVDREARAAEFEALAAELRAASGPGT